MSDLLSKLPLEISNKIYKDLLVDETDPIELQIDFRTDQRLKKKKLDTNILRVSKLVYAQASTVLYGKNRFSFKYPKTCVTRGGMSLFDKMSRPHNGAFDRIKHVDIVFSPGVHNHVCQDAEEIMAVVSHINNLRCSLKTLRLAFTLKQTLGLGWSWDRDRPDDNDGALAAARTIASSAVLIGAVSKIHVENKIEIVINSTNQSCLIHLKSFATRIGFEKQWTTTLQRPKSETEVNEESAEEEEDSPDSGKEAMEDSTYQKKHEHGHHCTCDYCDFARSEYDDSCSCDSFYSECDAPVLTRTWTLTPATDATRECIPDTCRS